MRMTLRFALWIFVSLWLSAMALAQDAVLTRAKAQLDAGQAQAAYDLLKPLESARAGDPEFDLLLGIAAVETKRTTEAVFALERVLAVRPNDARARAEIARAYFILGERRTSEIEFEQLRKRTDIPPAAQATINKYLEAIAQARTREGTSVTGYAEISFGWDSNVNTAPGSIGGVVPAIQPGVTPATRTNDTFLAGSGGIALRHVVNDRVTVFGNLDLSKRINGTVDTVDTGYWNFAGGFTYTVDPRNSFTVALQGQQFFVDNNRFRDAYGLLAQYQRALDDASALTLYAQHSVLDHPPANEARDAHRLVVGFGYARALKGPWDPVVFGGAYVGAERTRDPCSLIACFTHDVYGLRFGGQVTPKKDIVWFAAGSVERREYKGPFAPSTQDRHENQYDLRLGVNLTTAPLWTVSPQLAYTHNRSNTEVFDFQRLQAMITVRRDFR